MGIDNHANMTRRAFVKTALVTSVSLSFSNISYAKKHPNNTADGLLSLQRDGKIHIHSGGGNLGIYGQAYMLDELMNIFNCSRDYFIIENGSNPTQLPILLNQHSDHLSFSSAKTNRCAAKLLVSEIKISMAKNYGGKSANYHIKNGIIYNQNTNISFKDFSYLSNDYHIKGNVCENTLDKLNSIRENNLTVAVCEVI